MIPPDMLARLLRVESTAPVAAVSDLPWNTPQFVQGQKYQASVAAPLLNGNFKVLIAGQALQMRLPQSVQAGDRLELVPIATAPRLKFILLGNTRQGANDATSLSATGRFLGALAHEAAKAPAAQALSGAAPVLSSPPSDTRLVPGLLQQALSHSGLFYEFHQAQWVAGKRTLGQLMQEPQSALAAAPLPQFNQVTEDALPQPGVDSKPDAAISGTARNLDESVHEQAMTLVQHQLTVLETGQLTWRGEIWPGQWMDWEIADHHPAEREAAEPARWQTRLRLTLPNLGEVAASLALDSSGVHISLGAATTATTELMRDSLLPLAAAMKVAGLSVLAAEVHHDAGK